MTEKTEIACDNLHKILAIVTDTLIECSGDIATSIEVAKVGKVARESLEYIDAWEKRRQERAKRPTAVRAMSLGEVLSNAHYEIEKNAWVTPNDVDSAAYADSGDDQERVKIPPVPRKRRRKNHGCDHHNPPTVKEQQ